jgi:hypothetical protein
LVPISPPFGIKSLKSLQKISKKESKKVYYKHSSKINIKYKGDSPMSHDPYVMISMKIPFEMTKVDHKLMILA